MTLGGMLLIVLGIAALAYQGITYTSRETVIDIGPLTATADRERTLPLPPLVGGAAVLAGVALLVVGVRGKREPPGRTCSIVNNPSLAKRVRWTL